KTRVHPCTRPCGPDRLHLTATEGPEKLRDAQLFSSLIPWERRVAQVERGCRRVRGGERRACSRPWMAEFAPADGFRATQGTSTASSSMRALRVSFFLATVSLDKQRKVARWPEGTVKALDPDASSCEELDSRLRGSDKPEASARKAPQLIPSCHPPSNYQSSASADPLPPARSVRPCRRRRHPRPARGRCRP